MIRTIENPIIEEQEINGKSCFRFKFKEILSYTEAESFIEECKRLFNSIADEKVIIVWECLDMKNDKAEARAVFQKALNDLKDKIEMIWLVTDSILIQAEAEIISFFTSHKIHMVKSREELNHRIANQRINLA